MTEESNPRTITVERGPDWDRITPADGLPRATNRYWNGDQTPRETHTIIVQYVGNPDAIVARAKSDVMKQPGASIEYLLANFRAAIANNTGTSDEKRDALQRYGRAIAEGRHPVPTRAQSAHNWRKVTV